jgi:transcriptional regulator with XRE-family HTH domain
LFRERFFRSQNVTTYLAAPLRIRQANGYLVLVTERRATRDEGAQQTKRIMAAIRQLRTAKGWSAQQFADEMTKAGVPWNADIVVNLEHGRRRSLRVHEFLAAVFVLDAAQPLEALVPGDEVYPVVPDMLVDAEDIRAWLRGERRPLRRTVAEGAMSQSELESIAQFLDMQGQPDRAASMRKMAALLDVPADGAGGES